MDKKGRLFVNLALSLAILIAVIGVLMGSVQALLDRPIKRVEVSGALQYVSNAKIQQQLEFLVTQSFMSLDLPSVKAGLEQQPWVASAALSRRWPDELFVLITEQVPVARWLNSGFVNEAGQVITLPSGERPDLTKLPQFSGDPEKAPELLAFWRQIMPVFASSDWRMVGLSDAQNAGRKISVIPQGAVDVSTENAQGLNQVDFWLPTTQAIARLKHGLQALNAPVLSAKLPRIQSIDLRYADGFSVGWRAEPIRSG